MFFLVFSAFTYFLGYVVGTLKTDTTVRSPITFDVALTAVFGAALWVTYKRYEKKFDNLALGRAGEKFVARCLEELLPYGYTPVHDLVFTPKEGKRFNIDHVLVGPTGVFVVETKTRRKSRNEKINDKRDIEKEIRQVQDNAESLKKLLKERMGKTFSVTPILTYPRWKVEPWLTEQVIREDGVYVFSTAAIGKILHRYFQSHVLTDEDIQAIVHSLTTYAHDKSEEKVPLIYH